MKAKILMMGLTPPLEGGSERHIYEIASRISECKVFTQKGSLCKNKIETPIIKKPTFVRNVSFLIGSALYSLKLLLTKKEFECIHINENLLFTLIPILNKKYKIVVTVHGISGFKFYDNKFLWKIFKKFLKNIEIIAVNLEDEKRLKENFSVTYIPNGVDTSIYKKVKTGVEEKITFIGRIHEQKGVVYLLEAFNKISKKYPKLKLEIMGELNNYVIKLKSKYKNPKIFWKGYESDRLKIVKSLKSSYCIVLPSLWEGLPLTLLESLASSRPIILSDIPAFKSIISDEAIFFKLKSSEDLSNKIDLLMKNKQKANELGKKGEKLSRLYDWSIIAGKTEKIYNGKRK